MATTKDVETLKQNWFEDPCWDLETTEGFEDHHNELLAYRRQCEKQWSDEARAHREKENAALAKEASALGQIGLLRLIKHLQVQLDKAEERIHQLENKQG